MVSCIRSKQVRSLMLSIFHALLIEHLLLPNVYTSSIYIFIYYIDNGR